MEPKRFANICHNYNIITDDTYCQNQAFIFMEKNVAQNLTFKSYKK